MAKKYKLISDDSDLADDQKTVEVSEDVTETQKDKKTVAQLKEKHQRKLDRISNLGKEADEIVDELKAIESNISEITIKNIPSKVVDDTKDTPVVPKKL